MARKSDPLSGGFSTDEDEGWLAGLVADEDDQDRHTLWRLGLWGFAAVGALTLGILSSQLPVNAQRNQLAASEIAGRARDVEAAVQDNKLEARRLAAAVDTLNADRDRLFARLSSLEQGLDMVTGSIKKAEDKPATPWPDVSIAPVIESPPATIATIPVAPATPPASSAPAPSSAAASEPDASPVVLASRSEPTPTEKPASPSTIKATPIPDPLPNADSNPLAPVETPVPVANFGIDLGTANSINGLRALWRGLVKSHKAQLEALRPLIAVHERRNGLGLQVRLVAGPIKDAAAAAQICAVLVNADRDCKTTAFDGQRLSLSAEPEQKAPTARPPKRRSTRVQPEATPAKPANSSPSLATMLGVR